MRRIPSLCLMRHDSTTHLVLDPCETARDKTRGPLDRVPKSLFVRRTPRPFVLARVLPRLGKVLALAHTCSGTCPSNDACISSPNRSPLRDDTIARRPHPSPSAREPLARRAKQTTTTQVSSFCSSVPIPAILFPCPQPISYPLVLPYPTSTTLRVLPKAPG